MKQAEINAADLKMSQPMVIDGGSDVELSNLYFKDTGYVSGIVLNNVKGAFLDKIYGENMNLPVIYIGSGCENILITNAAGKKVNAVVYALQSDNVQVDKLSAMNVFRDYGNPISQFRGQAVQFDKCSGNNSFIKNVVIDCEKGNSLPEDLINIWDSYFEDGSPLIVENILARAFGGHSKNDGGLLLGDGGGKNQVLKNFILVNPGQYGAAMAGGQNLSISGGQIYSKRTDWSNVGLYAWNQYEHVQPMVNNKIFDNKVYWEKNSNPTSPYDDIWIHSNAGVSSEDQYNNIMNADLEQTLSGYISGDPIFSPFIDSEADLPTEPEPPTEPTDPETPIETMDSITINCATDTSNFEGNPPTTDKYVYAPGDGQALKFNYPLPNGEYKIDIEAVEDYWSGEGQRVFSIYAEGELTLSNIDLIKEVGKNNTFNTYFNVNVSDGELNIIFESIVNRALVSKITITPSTEAPTEPEGTPYKMKNVATGEITEIILYPN